MSHYDICPIPKPRMTQSDKWKQRPAVMRYRAFCDEVRLKRVKLPESGARVTFIIPMPASWSKRKRELMNNTAHIQRPDVDNLLKALQDAVYDDDCTIWDIRVTKIWGETGSIMIQE